MGEARGGSLPPLRQGAVVLLRRRQPEAQVPQQRPVGAAAAESVNALTTSKDLKANFLPPQGKSARHVHPSPANLITPPRPTWLPHSSMKGAQSERSCIQSDTCPLCSGLTEALSHKIMQPFSH